MKTQLAQDHFSRILDGIRVLEISQKDTFNEKK